MLVLICPNCSTHIPNGSVRCPACHADVSAPVAAPQPQGRWCPACGAAVTNEDEVCPACGMPLDEVPRYRQDFSQDVQDAPELVEADELDEFEDEASPAETRKIPRIESAIPAEDDPQSKSARNEGMPRASRFILAAVASLLFVCGLALFITHPWDRSDHSNRATEEADTSMAGFPGVKEALSGQDTGKGDKQEVVSGDETTFEKLEAAHDELGKLSQRADDSTKHLYESGFSGTDDERKKGRAEAEQLALDVSNLIGDIEKVDVTSGVYAEEREHVLTLASWLRNRVDTLFAGWKQLDEAEDAQAIRKEVEGKVGPKDAASLKASYAQLFAENYDAWKPQRKNEAPQQAEAE